MKHLKPMGVMVLVLALNTTPGFALERYWLGTTSTDFGTVNNWSTVSGGGGAAGVPQAGDNIRFDSNGTNSCVLAPWGQSTRP